MEQSAGATTWQRTLWVVWVGQGLVVIGFNFINPFVALFIQELGYPDPKEAVFWGGLSQGAMGLGLVIMAPVWGIIGDRYGRKANLLRAMFTAAIVLGLTGLVRNVYQLVAMRFLLGCLSGTFATSTALVASQAPREKMGYAMGVMQASMFIGGTVGPLVGGVLVDITYYRASFFITGIIQLIGALLVLSLVKEEFQPPPPEQRQSLPGMLGDWWRLMSRGQVLTLLSVIFLAYLFLTFMMPALPVFMAELTGAGVVATSAGLALALLGATGILSSLLMGWVSRRFNMKAILVASILATGLFYLPIAAVRDIVPFLVLMALLGFTKGGVMSITNALVGIAVPRERHSSAYGAVQMANSLSSSIGPVLGGMTAATLGLRSVFLVNGLALLVTGLVVARLLVIGKEASLKVRQPPPRLAESNRPRG